MRSMLLVWFRLRIQAENHFKSDIFRFVRVWLHGINDFNDVRNFQIRYEAII